MKKITQNIPNMITLSRIISSLIAPMLFLTGNIPISIGLYVYGAISDMLDGFLARKLNAFTDLGRKLDPISDKIYALSLLAPSLILGNLLMLIPLILETEISSTIISAQKANITLETERVGKYKTWFLFPSIIIGLLATQNPAFYFPLVPLLGYTTHFQIQTIKAYENQYHKKLNQTNNQKEDTKIRLTSTPKQAKEPIKTQIKNHYDEFIFYQNIEVHSPQTNSKKRRKIKNNNY